MNSMKQGIVFRLLTMIMALHLLFASTAWASDTEIYKMDTTGTKTAMLMVDTSKTMVNPTVDILGDYPLCLGDSLLKPIQNLLPISLNLNLLGLVKVHLSGDPSVLQDPANVGQFCDIIFPAALIGTLESIDGLLSSITDPLIQTQLLGLKGSYNYIKSSCDPLSSVQDSDPTLLQIGNIGYRCYSRLGRVKKAVIDVLDGNSARGVEKLPNGVVLGLTVFPARSSATDGTTVNQKAGMILVAAKPLNDTQRATIKAAVRGIQVDNTPLSKVFGLVSGILSGDTNVLGTATQALGSILNAALTCVINLISCLLGGLSGLLNDVLGTVTTLLGINGTNVPTATAYAETGAYLLSQTTAGTVPVITTTTVAYASGTGYVNSCDASYVPANGNYRCNPTPDGNGVRWEQQYSCFILCSWGDYARSSITKPYNLDGYVLLTHYYYYRTTNTNYQNSVYSGFTYPSSTYASTDSAHAGDPAYNFTYSANNNASSIKNATSYTGPTLSLTSDTCSGQGIFVLTGNTPDLGSAPVISELQGVMSKSLSASNGFSCSGSIQRVTGASVDGSPKATWNCIDQYSQWLLNKTGMINGQNTKIRTGVAGIGREFVSPTPQPNILNFLESILNSIFGVLNIPGFPLNGVLSSTLNNTLLPAVKSLVGISSVNVTDIENLKQWGINGEGGYAYEVGPGSIAKSIYNFVQGLPAASAPPFKGVVVTPTDSLSPYTLQNNVYNTMFNPTTGQIWFGNVKKYLVLNSTIGNVDQWSNTTSSDIFSGGMLSQLSLGGIGTPPVFNRKLWINRAYTGSAFQESTSLQAVTSDYVRGSCKDSTKPNDPLRAYLMALLGYNVTPSTIIDCTTLDNALSTATELRQVGAPMHSAPILLTQSAVVGYDGVTTSQRDDYLLFGTTQGLLHVLDATTGQEKWAFLPNEMLESAAQQPGFLDKSKVAVGVANMPYGIDAPWAVYSQYVRDTNGKMTVANVTSTIQGKQYVYGGLRMGGRGYYSFDLKDISNPALKFHISPSGACSSTNPLGCMGQSWSKPTIATVMWPDSTDSNKLKPRLVMFVGGGYDAGGTDGNGTLSGSTRTYSGYEDPAYDQSNLTNPIGAGVYMFDANTGSLLWWASKNAASTSDNTTASYQSDLKYSVVSRINAVDRNGDGLVDHLYFGDLGGQVWRIDLNNARSTATTAFATHVVKLLNLNGQTPRPRFYDAPTFSVYGQGTLTKAVLNIGSGNRSRPLDKKTATDPVIDRDGAVYAIFDSDVTKTGLYSPTMTLSNTLALSDLTNITTVTSLTDAQKAAMKGWYYSYTSGAAGTKTKSVMDEMSVINKNLYVSVYDPTVLSGTTCGTGVAGQSEVRRYCLPYGVCSDTDANVNRLIVGNGISAINIGVPGAGSGQPYSRTVLGGITGGTNPSGTKVAESQIATRKVVPLRWYEKYAQ